MAAVRPKAAVSRTSIERSRESSTKSIRHQASMPSTATRSTSGARQTSTGGSRIPGGTRDARIRASRARLSARRLPVIALEADTLAFVRPTVDRLAARPSAILVDDFERACPNMQSVGTRLVLTQSTYLVQSWIDL